MPEILVISGDIGLSHFLTEGLLPEGFWTSSVAGGFQALEVFRLRQFDLVLLDATIGDIGPAELVRRLRSGPAESGATDHPRTDAPIVIIAADQAEIDAARIPESMISAIVMPPIEIDELAAALGEIIAMQQPESGTPAHS